MTVKLTVKGDWVEGELALSLPPGTSSAAQDKAVGEALARPLEDAAAELGVVLAAAPRRFARPLPGKDANGNTRYAVAARVEGERLVPALDPDRLRRR